MQTVRTTNYRLQEEHTIHRGIQDSKSLPQGSYICPIKLGYVPKHIVEADNNRWHNPETEVFCFTKYGIVSIPRYKIRGE